MHKTKTFYVVARNNYSVVKKYFIYEPKQGGDINMKKAILFLSALAAAMCIAPIANAQVGDVIGHIYSTDIRAYINGEEVPSYNIGGRTVIVVEDVCGYSEYHDEMRTLLLTNDVRGLHPDSIKGGSGESDTPGHIIGDIYETDIKTYMYDKEITAYNLDGKTAVAIEDLGGFKEYNDLGGRYFYNDETRTLSLEILYGNHAEVMGTLFDNAADITYSLSDDKSHIIAQFGFNDMFSVGGNITEDDGLRAELNKKGECIIPVMVVIDGEEKQLGYYFAHDSKHYEQTGYRTADGGFTDGYGYNFTGGETEVYELQDTRVSFYSISVAFAEEIGATVEHPVLTKREEVEKDWRLHRWNKVTEKFVTDDYTFIYAGFYGGPHGGAYESLLLIDDDGNYKNFADDLESVSLYGQKTFENVTIDRENEKCYLHYDIDYVIDLRTGEMTAREN